MLNSFKPQNGFEETIFSVNSIIFCWVDIDVEIGLFINVSSFCIDFGLELGKQHQSELFEVLEW